MRAQATTTTAFRAVDESQTILETKARSVEGRRPQKDWQPLASSPSSGVSNQVTFLAACKTAKLILHPIFLNRYSFTRNGSKSRFLLSHSPSKVTEHERHLSFRAELILQIQRGTIRSVRMGARQSSQGTGNTNQEGNPAATKVSTNLFTETSTRNTLQKAQDHIQLTNGHLHSARESVDEAENGPTLVKSITRIRAQDPDPLDLNPPETRRIRTQAPDPLECSAAHLEKVEEHLNESKKALNQVKGTARSESNVEKGLEKVEQTQEEVKKAIHAIYGSDVDQILEAKEALENANKALSESHKYIKRAKEKEPKRADYMSKK